MLPTVCCCHHLTPSPCCHPTVCQCPLPPLAPFHSLSCPLSLSLSPHGCPTLCALVGTISISPSLPPLLPCSLAHGHPTLCLHNHLATCSHCPLSAAALAPTLFPTLAHTLFPHGHLAPHLPHYCHSLYPHQLTHSATTTLLFALLPCPCPLSHSMPSPATTLPLSATTTMPPLLSLPHLLPLLMLSPHPPLSLPTPCTHSVPLPSHLPFTLAISAPWTPLGPSSPSPLHMQSCSLRPFLSCLSLMCAVWATQTPLRPCCIPLFLTCT